MRWHFKFFQTILLLFYFHSHAHLCNNVSFSSKLINQMSNVKNVTNVKGAHQLKRYLSHYGYLNHNQTNEHDNIFDDSLKLALKKYQQFYKLNITGILDQETLTKMCQPRCGMPDFINLRIKPLPFHVISHYSFLRGKPKWRTMNLTYSFDSNVLEEAKSALQLALDEWASVTPFEFHMVENFNESNIKFSFLSGDHGDDHPFLGQGQLGHAFPPPDGRIHFDNDEVWSWTGERNGYDFETVGLHELGHALGLDHSDFFKAVMYPIIKPRVRKRLAQDDIDGIKALYKLKGR